jgi:hypothetical protein
MKILLERVPKETKFYLEPETGVEQQGKLGRHMRREAGR